VSTRAAAASEATTGARVGAEPRPVVLVVDDDPMTRFLARTATERAGFEVIEAGHGREALARFDDARPDVVLLDVMMPEMDGFEACAALRELQRGAYVPVVMMTGLDDVESIDAAYEAGATDFITKPLNCAILTHRLRYLLRGKQTADDLRASEARLAHAQRIAKLGHWEWDPTEGTALWSEQCRRLIGVPLAGSFRGWAEWASFIHSDDRTLVRNALNRALETGGVCSVEHRLAGPGGEDRVVQQEIEMELDDAGLPVRFVGTVQDITERRLAEQQIRYLAYYDSVTGLPNRTLLTDHATHALLRARRQGRLAALLFLDLDHFKRVNDTLGHNSGDRLLKQVAARLTRCVRSSDYVAREGDVPVDDEPWLGDTTVARLGGDEFVILLSDLRSAEDAAVAAQRLGRTLTDPIQVQENDVYATASIGISVYPVDGDDVETLLKHADSAMYHAKSQGRNCYQFFTASMNSRVLERLSLETSLRKAIEREELVLHYQPKVELESGCVTGMEALVRWASPDLGMVSPNDFIPVAEETGLIIPLGGWVLRAACAQLRAWRDAGHEGLQMSVNLSAAQFAQKDLVDEVSGALEASGLGAGCLELELTESMLVDNVAASQSALRALAALGVRLSIDDFGTGYSSLSYLKRFPIDTLKIDQSFVRDIAVDPDDAAIVTAITSLGHSLRLSVVAEGVEEFRQLAFLRAHGCDQAQGYLVSRPCPAAEAGEWLREHAGGWRAQPARARAAAG